MKFEKAVSQAGVRPGEEMEAAVPARPATLVSDLLVPLGQSVVTGALFGGLVVFFVNELVPGWEADRSVIWGLTSLAIAALSWICLLGQTRKLMWAREKVTGRDLDGDGQVGKPTERVVIVNAERSQAEAEKRAGAERASDFARFVAGLGVKGTDSRTWEPELGREVYQDYRDALIRLGWAEWNKRNGNGEPVRTKGWRLVQDPEEILERISG